MSAYINYPHVADVTVYSTLSAFPSVAANGAIALAADTDILYAFNTGSVSWVVIGGSGAPLAIGAIDGQSPSANALVIASNVLYAQSASATAPGMVNLTTQSFAGNKTFTGTIAAANLSGTNTGDVTLAAVGSSPSANGASLAGQVLTLQPADTTHPGALTAADWNTFNSKQPAGNYITALTGDVTASGPGSVAATVAKIQGTTVSGTTGSANVVFSSAPTLSNPVVGTQSQGDTSTKAASTAYVDTAVANAVAGVNPAVAVQAATTAAGDTSGFTYNNGVSGIGATFTGVVNTAITIDGYTFTALGQRLLVKNDTQSPSGAFNGIYYVTQMQTGVLAPVLTRALDYDMPSDMNNTGAIPVINGTVNGTTQWVLTSLVVTVGTTPLTFTKFSSNPATIGTVTSVAMTVPAFLSVSGSPVTTAGTLAVTLSGTALPIANGGTAATSVTTAPAATTFAGWDANKNLSSNNFIEGYATTPTAAATTTLTVASAWQQYFTGSTTQTVTLPVASTLVLGQSYQIVNSSTGTVTVNSSGANLVQSLPAGTSAVIVCILTSGTNAASWSVIPTATGNYTVDTFSGDGATTAFTLSVAPASANNAQVFVSGVYQFKSTFSLSTTTLTFTTAPPTGTSNIQVVSGTSLSIGTPADGTVTYAKLAASTLAAPTVQKFISTGTQTGWLFTISTSSTVAVGDTYTNNSNTYTVQNALTATSGQVLWMSGTGATSGTTLTRSAGAGTASITFSTKIATATYTTPSSPRAPLYIKVKGIGGGGGGGGSGTASSSSNGTTGVSTGFGANIILAGPGIGANFAARGGAGGTVSLGTAVGISIPGGTGTGVQENLIANSTNLSGAPGGNGMFGGAGGGGPSATSTGAESNAATNSGSGGGGGGSGGQAANASSPGGGAGGGFDAIITSLAATYPYVVGTGGAGGSAGTNGFAGGNGADGFIEVTEYYQ